MKTDNFQKQAVLNEMDGGSMSVHHLLTADEFIAQMEPRIRSMFKWNSSELKNRAASWRATNQINTRNLTFFVKNKNKLPKPLQVSKKSSNFAAEIKSFYGECHKRKTQWYQ